MITANLVQEESGKLFAEIETANPYRLFSEEVSMADFQDYAKACGAAIDFADGEVKAMTSLAHDAYETWTDFSDWWGWNEDTREEYVKELPIYKAALALDSGATIVTIETAQAA